jgi:hypothetical protein
MSQRLSLLEAVNQLLSCIGEAPVSSLEDDKTADVSAAVEKINFVSRDVQARGFDWNTDYDYVLAVQEGDKVAVPDDALLIEFPRRFNEPDPVQRGRFFWDRKDKTFEFADALTATRIVWLLDFEELPQPAASYVLARAKREYISERLDASQVPPDVYQQEQRKWTELLNHQLRNNDTRASYQADVYSIISRTFNH